MGVNYEGVMDAVKSLDKQNSKKREKSRGNIEYEDIRAQRLNKDNYTCQKCGISKGSTGIQPFFEVDHIEERQHGGSDRLENLQTLCVKCHMEKHDVEIDSISDFPDRIIRYIDHVSDEIFCYSTKFYYPKLVFTLMRKFNYSPTKENYFTFVDEVTSTTDVFKSKWFDIWWNYVYEYRVDGSRDKIVCYNCSESFKDIHRHWSNTSQCHPENKI